MVINLITSGVNYNSEMEGTLKIQILRQEDKYAFDLDFEAGRHTFNADPEVGKHRSLIQTLRLEETPLIRAAPSCGSLNIRTINEERVHSLAAYLHLARIPIHSSGSWQSS